MDWVIGKKIYWYIVEHCQIRRKNLALKRGLPNAHPYTVPSSFTQSSQNSNFRCDCLREIAAVFEILMRVNQGPKRPLKREREKIWGKNQFCRAGAGAGGAEIVLLTWSRNRSRT